MEIAALRQSLGQTFAALLSGTLKREEAERWAEGLIAKSESVVAAETWRNVDPDLWETIIFLSGCAQRDLSESDCGYLVTDEDIADQARAL
ncbi:hypothetical protein [Vannielia litorea]|uniref:hypothetical protein n=1 Tax=Vannielia litorea TaxID=1217970 RepID=UPI001BCA837B|nr:hypothetical protein [Vannielia litorea]MBS8227775.1 hypothetical protein [Vannielia litorea]